MTTTMRAAALAALTAVLAGCGGGGDGGDNAFQPPTNDFNAFAAWQNVVDPVAAFSRQVSGVGSDGVRYSATVSVRTLADAVFTPIGGAPFYVTELRSSLSQSGNVQEINNAEVYFDQSDWQVYGVRRTRTIPPGLPQAGTSITCDVAVENQAPPVAAKLNSSGLLYDADIQADCTGNGAVIGTSRATWSLEWEGFSATPYFCVLVEDRGLGTNPVITQDETCWEVQPDGALSGRARSRVTVAGNTPSFTAIMDNY